MYAKDFAKLLKELNDPSYQSQMVKNVPIPKLGHIRDKFSSTETLFLSPTQSILAPSVEEALKSLAVCLYWKMKENEAVEHKVFMEIFSEEFHPLRGTPHVNFTKTPVIDEIHSFLKVIYDTEDLSAESAVMALVYIERLITVTNITLHATNWRYICFGSIIIASKVWEDTAVWNSDFRSVFPKLRLNHLGKLEREYLKLLDFNVAIKSSIYAKYYFSLRSIAERNEINFPLQPLTKSQQQKLESKSRGLTAKVKQFQIHRSNSLCSYLIKDVQLGGRENINRVN